MTVFLARIGYRTRTLFERTAQILDFAVKTFRAFLLFYQPGFRSAFYVVLRQVYFTGIQGLPVVFIIGLIIGSVVITQIFPMLKGMGAENLLSSILVIAIIRELGPLLTALILVGRSGTAVASELGTNKVLREIEALEMMGINPFYYLVAPRVIGIVIATFCLTIYFDLIALLGGFVVASFQMPISLGHFTTIIMNAISTKDIVVSVMKSLLFGVLIALTCCFNGLSAGHATTDVPIVTSRAVIESFIIIFIASGVISLLFYL